MKQDAKPNVIQVKENIIELLKKPPGEDRGIVLLMEGEWGTGKTYLFSNGIVPGLKEKEETEVIYVSLFGLQSRKDVIETLINKVTLVGMSTENIKKLVSTAKKFVSEIFPGVKGELIQYVGSKLVDSLSDFSIFPENTVVCFDDVERIGKDLDIDEFLGIVDLLVNQKKTRILLIGNISRLEKTKKEKFKIFKEKVVDYTFHLVPDIKTVMDSLLSDRYKELRENKELFDFELEVLKWYLQDIIINTANGNLRTLHRILQNISRLQENIKALKNEGEVRKDCRLSLDVIQFIVAVTVEHILKPFNNVEEVIGKFQTISQTYFSSPMEKAKNNGESDHQKELDRFEKYFPQSLLSIRILNSIAKFIIEGILDEKLLVNEFVWCQDPKDKHFQRLTKVFFSSGIYCTSKWFYWSDKKANDYLGGVVEFLRQPEKYMDVPVFQIIELVCYTFDMLGYKVGRSLPEDVKQKIKEYLDKKAEEAGGTKDCQGFNELLADITMNIRCGEVKIDEQKGDKKKALQWRVLTKYYQSKVNEARKKCIEAKIEAFLKQAPKECLDEDLPGLYRLADQGSAVILEFLIHNQEHIANLYEQDRLKYVFVLNYMVNILDRVIPTKESNTRKDFFEKVKTFIEKEQKKRTQAMDKFVFKDLYAKLAEFEKKLPQNHPLS